VWKAGAPGLQRGADVNDPEHCQPALAGPLQGVRVLELAGIGPGPFACMLFADLGAEVIRIDRPASGPQVPDPRFDLTTRGRSSIVLDLKRPGAAQVLLRIAEHCDILVEGYRPGVAERLGIGPRECLERQPSLVYARMTGWGQDGPLAATAGHDINYIAVAGALHGLRRAGEAPLPPTNLLGDFGGGALYLAFGVLAALTAARGSGQGQVVDAAIVDGTANLLAMQLGLMAAGVWDAGRPGTNMLDSGAPFYNVYETADGGHISVGAIEPRFYSELVTGLGIAEAELPPQLKRRGWAQTRQRFAEIFRTRTRDEWTDHFAGTDACVAPVLSVTEAAEHPHLRHRGTYVRGPADALQPAPAPRFSQTPATVPAAPRAPGQDTIGVLERCGFSDAEVSALRAAGLLDGLPVTAKS
jgi:alpha-methylacyl-CoA racemase